MTTADRKPRKVIPVRLDADVIPEVDDCARIEQRNRSDMLRLLIAEGLKTYRRRQEMAGTYTPPVEPKRGGR